ncbi:ATP-grasp ribosomal peptide maturase [Fodinicola feengrottensis]|uniref:ATP-grasp ribosomal peptide maturase n=2 Tax=Fodinicola feengrottensis TaxID=435914 RepID=A0ABP4VDD2_9ACTN
MTALGSAAAGEGPMVLVLGQADDWAVEQVGASLDARGVRWMVLDTADFPQRMALSAQLSAEPEAGERAGSGGWGGEVEVAGQVLRLRDVAAVYYRKPGAFDLPAGLSEPERRFCNAQARTGVGGVLASLAARWVSHPGAIADAEYKPRQLAQLKHAGLAVAPTLITNNPADVRDFAAAYGDLVVKPLAEPIVWEDGGESIVYTRRLSRGDIERAGEELASVAATAHLFQVWQDKKCECRVTAVGDKLFAVAIHADSSAALVDWRSDYDNLRYEPIEVPVQVRAGIAAYLRSAGLAYSAFDFVIRPDGQWITLEANANGVWGWLAEECDLPIADAIADCLTATNLNGDSKT